MAAGSHWAAALVGEPWTPERNCWWLVRRVQRERFGVEMPEIEVGGADQVDAVRVATAGWRRIETPAREGDVLLCRQPGGGRHVGVVVESDCARLLHSPGRMTPRGPVGCVEAPPLRDLAAEGYREIELWRRA